MSGVARVSSLLGRLLWRRGLFATPADGDATADERQEKQRDAAYGQCQKAIKAGLVAIIGHDLCAPIPSILAIGRVREAGTLVDDIVGSTGILTHLAALDTVDAGAISQLRIGCDQVFLYVPHRLVQADHGCPCSGMEDPCFEEEVQAQRRVTSWVQKHGHVIVHAGLVQLIHQHSPRGWQAGGEDRAHLRRAARGPQRFHRLRGCGIRLHVKVHGNRGTRGAGAGDHCLQVRQVCRGAIVVAIDFRQYGEALNLAPGRIHDLLVHAGHAHQTVIMMDDGHVI
mmetsp:Transcript_60729/g.144729  ORF Transcript_60729/g.144729 Transcript_60729/m.144729 type:complete len:283 (+) Transcript_60729:200-1048(+)